MSLRVPDKRPRAGELRLHAGCQAVLPHHGRALPRQRRVPRRRPRPHGREGPDAQVPDQNERVRRQEAVQISGGKI